MIKIFIFLFGLTLGYATKTSVKTKDPCQDYPSCKLISDQMFANYCGRSTLKNMCPTHCDPKCNNSTSEISVKVLSIESLEEDDYSEEDDSHPTSLSTSPTTTTTKKAKHSRKKNSKKKNKQVTKASTTSTTTTTTLTTPIEVKTTEEVEEESDENEETSPIPELKFSKLKTEKTEETENTSTVTTSTVKVLQTEIDETPVTKTMANLPNGYFKTIYVPLYEAGFVQRVIPTSNKPECDFSQAVVCKKEKCSNNAVWCPVTNDVPKEQLEILLNYTTDIYMFETQGRIENNETVTNFLLQYLNDAGVLVSHLYRTDTKNSSVINKFMFEPAIRTNYIRLTPIDFVESIALRFEVYSKGVLYKPDKER